jgi:hypothetical protein
MRTRAEAWTDKKESDMLGNNHVAVRTTMPTLADIPKDTSEDSAEQPRDNVTARLTRCCRFAAIAGGICVAATR